MVQTDNLLEITMKERLIRLGYLLGISLLLAAIIYFFAANWPGFDKWVKISLSLSLLAIFYGLSILLSRIFHHQVFLSEFMLFAGCIAFGVGTGLLGQIYNSHADSYLLFMVWLIPTFLFSIVTRYQPFYVLSHILLHLVVWFFMFPSSVTISESELSIVMVFIGLALLNGVIFFLIEIGILVSKAMKYVTFVTFHIIMIAISMTHLFEEYGLILNFIYVPILAFLFYYFLKINAPKSMVILLGLVTSGYILIKFAELLISYSDSEVFYLLVILFAAAIVVANVYLIKWLNGPTQEDSERKTKSRIIWQKLLLGFITSIASILATSSLMGFIVLVTGSFSEYLFLFIAVVIFILPMMFIRSIDPTIRYTLLCIGYLMGAAAVHSLPIVFFVGYLILLGVSWGTISSSGVRSFTFLIANIMTFFVLWSEWVDIEVFLMLMIGVNAVLYVVSRFLADPEIKASLMNNSMVYVLTFFFFLTFTHEYFETMYYVFNALFFIAVTALVFWSIKHDRQYEFRLALLFWFAFLVYKYYDFVWKLFHKSIALFILGIIFIVVAYAYDQRNRQNERVEPSFLKTKLLMISLVIIMQFVTMGFQIAKSEYVLAKGELIKLELQPLDPRSLIQGDYVILNYTISTIDLGVVLEAREKVEIILTPNDEGVYVYKGVFRHEYKYNKPYERSDKDVLINARSNGSDRFIYGIESFFVPEGTGREVEGEAKFAYVKVASNGDAILVRLSGE
jgi:uncharacterized membrane-anchored protein/uncharacterized membrane protein